MSEPSTSQSPGPFTVFIESPQGESSITVEYGDICLAEADLVVVSSHANPSKPLFGGAIDGLADSLDFDLQKLELTPLITPRYTIDGQSRVGTFGTHLATPPSLSACPHAKLLVVRLPDSHRVSDPLDLYETALHSLLGAITYLEVGGQLSGVRTMAMTVIAGAPERGFPPEDVLRLLLRMAQRLLRMTTELRHVRLVLRDVELARLYRDALESIVAPPRLVAPDTALRALIDELQRVLVGRPFDGADASLAFVNELREALGNPELSLVQLGAAGRKMAEFVTGEACGRLPAATARLAGIKPRNRTLMASIDALTGAVAPWVIIHLHNLRTLGNEAVHYRGSDVDYIPTRLTAHEALALLVSVHRCAIFWCELLQGQRELA